MLPNTSISNKYCSLELSNHQSIKKLKKRNISSFHASVLKYVASQCHHF